MNPAHPDFKRINVGKPAMVEADLRPIDRYFEPCGWRSLARISRRSSFPVYGASFELIAQSRTANSA